MLKVELFITSLWLLFLLVFIYTIRIPTYFGANYEFIGFLNLLELNIVPSVCIIFMLFGLFYYFKFDYKIVKGAPNLPQKIIKVSDINYETVSFLITYIIPLLLFVMDFDVHNIRNLIMFLAILLIIGTIYCRTNLFYTNPSLAILGYKIYKVETAQNSDMIVIIKGKLHEGDFILPRLIDDNIYFTKKVQNGKD